MTTTLIDRSTLDAASTESRRRAPFADLANAIAPAGASAGAVHPGASVCGATTAMFPATTITTNPWLGDDAQDSAFGSEYATKRITPGRLEGMT